MAGSFTSIGTVNTPGIAAFDSATGQWSTFGAGLSGGRVLSLAVSASGDLIAGGSFTSAGLGIARWDGAAWLPLGTGLQHVSYPPFTKVRAMEVMPNGDLIAAGTFSDAGGVSVSGIARWDGASWHSMAASLGSSANVYSLALLPSGDLLVGGEFTSVAGVATSGAALWSGGSWNSFPSPPGVLPRMHALTLSPSGDVFAAWKYVTTEGVYRFQAGAWQLLGAATSGVTSPPPDVLHLFAESSTQLYATGIFDTLGGASATGLAEWNGTSWSPVGGSLASPGYGFTTARLPNGLLAAGGFFATVAGRSIPHLATWNGHSWQSTNNLTVNSDVRCIERMRDGSVIVAGEFTTAGTTPASCIAQWDGASWSSLGSGLTETAPFTSPQVNAVAEMPDGTIIAGGSFSHAGGVPANSIAKWDGSAWSPLGNGISGRVDVLLVLRNNDLVAGGSLSAGPGMLNIARWDGTSWHELAGGRANPVTSLAQMADDSLAVGGYISNGVQQWNGNYWSHLGSLMTFGHIRTMITQPDGSLVVAGQFASVGTGNSPNIARWNGTAWVEVGPGVGSSPGTMVEHMVALPDGSFVACRAFDLRHWRGSSWTNLATLNRPHGVAVDPRGNLLVGGEFTSVNGSPASRLVQLAAPCPATETVVGPGCNGLDLITTRVPFIGGALEVEATGFTPVDLALVVVGFGATNLPLASVFPTAGAGCTLWTTTDYLEVVLPAAGSVGWQLAIPDNAALIGSEFYQQILQLSVTAQLDLFGSPGLRYSIGALH